MPAARYWRITGLTLHGPGDLTMLDIGLYSDGVRVDAAVTRIATVPPLSGTTFAATDVAKSGFAFVWDFGSAQEVDDAQFTLDAASAHIHRYHVESSENGEVWASAFRWWGSFGGSPLVQLPSIDPHYKNVLALLDARLGLLDCFSRNGGDFINTGAAPFRRSFDASVSDLPFISNNDGEWYTVIMASKAMPATILGDFSVELIGVPTLAGYEHPGILCGFGLNGWRLAVGAYTFSLYYPLRVIRPDGRDAGYAHNALYYAQAHSIKWIRASGTHRVVLNGSVLFTFFDDSPITFDEVVLGRWRRVCVPFNFISLRITEGVDRGNGPIAGLPYLEYPRTSGMGATTAAFAGGYDTPTTAAQLDPSHLHLDTVDGGTVSVSGTVKKMGLPANLPLRRRVRLYHSKDRRFIRETWSDADTGEFSFTGLKAGEEMHLIAHDHEHTYRALVRDKVVGT